MQLTAEGEFFRATIQPFFGGEPREIGIVVLFRKVREDQMARLAIEYFGIGQKFTYHGVREMAGATHHPLLDVPGIRSHLEHVQIVIRFENQNIGFAQIVFHELGHVAQVGNDGHFGAARAKCVAYWIGSIVRNSERIDFDIADLEALACLDVFDALHLLHRPLRMHLENLGVSRIGHIRGAVEHACQLRHAAGMIGVFVRDENSVNALRLLPA